jgi:hypothetical protein
MLSHVPTAIAVLKKEWKEIPQQLILKTVMSSLSVENATSVMLLDALVVHSVEFQLSKKVIKSSLFLMEQTSNKM